MRLLVAAHMNVSASAGSTTLKNPTICPATPLRRRSHPSYNAPPCEAPMPFSLRLYQSMLHRAMRCHVQRGAIPHAAIGLSRAYSSALPVHPLNKPALPLPPTNEG